MHPHPTPSVTPIAPAADAAARNARFWNRVARKYAADSIADAAGYERTVQRVQALLSPSDSVLEIGCGTGTTALRLAGATRRMLATDVSTEMIAIARQKLLLRPTPQLRFGVADAENSPAGGALHDTVLAFNLFHLVADLDVALQVIKQTLKPGGLFLSKTPCLAEMNPLITRLAVPLMRALGKAPDLLIFSGAQLETAFRRQGLEIDAVERHGSKRKDIRVFIVARRPR